MDDLPTVEQRVVGANYVRRYGHLAADDPHFFVAALYRMMMLARSNPDAPELRAFKDAPLSTDRLPSMTPAQPVAGEEGEHG